MKSESEIVREICDWLYGAKIFFWRSNNIPAPGRALPKYTPRGLPDIFVLVKPFFIGCEVKRPGAGMNNERELNGRLVRAGILSPEQALFGGSFDTNGGKYIVVHSLSEFQLQLANIMLPVK